MGILRVLLAIAVVLVHSKNHSFYLVDGQSAVEVFYAISGFYMALILNEKYKDIPNANGLFWRNRFLRIFPLYWTVAGLTVFMGIVLFVMSHGRSMLPFQEYLRDASTGKSVFNPAAVLYVFVTNIIVFGQDLAQFFQLDPMTGALSYKPGLSAQEGFYPFWRFLLIPPAWTLSLELMFYLIAPFLVRARQWKWLVGVFLLSCAVRFALWKFGITFHPWRYMFFPAELVFFLAGSAIYFAKGWAVASQRFQSLVIPITAAVIAVSVLFDSIPVAKDIKAPIYIACVILSIPALFLFSSRFKWDRNIGELSYPVYILHMLVMHCFEASFIPKVLQNPIVTIVATIAGAAALNKFVALPIERRRQKPFSKSAATLTPAVASPVPAVPAKEA